MSLYKDYEWRGRRVRWSRAGSGPALVFCHGTPWSSYVWRHYAEALSNEFTVYLWDMPGYGQSSKDAGHRVSLDVQGELFADLLRTWNLRTPHVVAHDYGGTVALRAHLVHGSVFKSLALVDVVALAPWGSEFFKLVRDHAHVFGALPPHVHEGVLRAYIAGASHIGLIESDLEALIRPWLGKEGQEAFYQQIVQADERYTNEIEANYKDVHVPTLIAWGREDAWIPVDRAQRLAKLIPNAQLDVIEGAGHLIQFDQPAALAMTLQRWLSSNSG